MLTSGIGIGISNKIWILNGGTVQLSHPGRLYIYEFVESVILI